MRPSTWSIWLSLLLAAPVWADDSGIQPGQPWIDDGTTVFNPDNRDVDFSDDTPHLTLRDSDTDVAFELHVEDAAADPFRGFTIWQGTQTASGATFNVGPSEPTLRITQTGTLFFDLLQTTGTARCLELAASGQVTLAASSCGTGGGSGDVTDVGPGCATGACLTNGLATVGGVLGVWEGTTVDANDINFNIASDPASNVTLTFPTETGTFCTTGSVCTGYVGTTRTLTGGVGIAALGDLSADRTVTFDATEISSLTWGAGAFTTMTFDAGVTDPVLTASGTGTLNLSTGTLQYGGNTVATSANNLSFFASTTSAQLATLLSDETGTAGKAVFDTAPTFVTSLTTPVVISGAADPADAGALRLGNAETLAWEASPTGTDLTVTMDANNVLTSSVPINATTGFRIGNAAASGAILIGNGTNYVASTPTYPNASATSGTYIKSNGTNYIASTGSASGTGACTNQFPRTLNSDAAPTCASVSMVNDVTGTLGTANGGTGVATLTANGILYGNGAGAILATASGGVNTVLTANGGPPSFSATPTITSLTATGTITAGGFTLNTGQLLTLGGGNTINFSATTNDIEVSNDVNITDPEPHVQYIDSTASENDYEHFADNSQFYLREVTSVPAVTLMQFDRSNNLLNLRGFEQERCGLFENLVAANDNMLLWAAKRTLTVTKVSCKVSGFTTAPALTLEDDSGNAMTGTPVCSPIGNWAAVTAANSVTSGEGIRFDTTNTPAPITGTQSLVCFVFTEDNII